MKKINDDLILKALQQARSELQNAPPSREEVEEQQAEIAASLEAKAYWERLRKPRPPLSEQPINWQEFDFFHDELLLAKHRIEALHQAGKGCLILTGSTGSGKTHMAKAMAATYRGKGCFIRESDLLQKIRTSYGRRDPKPPLNQYKTCPLLCLDDLGMAHVREQSLPWMQEQYYILLEARAADKLTIITTNLSFKQLEKRLGVRAFSRLIGILKSKDNFIHLTTVPDHRFKDW